jgi:transcriptional regulator with XRE-family HTH domain
MSLECRAYDMVFWCQILDNGATLERSEPMNQPYLGQKVAELRQQKGFTQEKLAEMCEVSPRTIQRIESGEVDPRAYTLQCLSGALEFDFGELDTANDNVWLAILHLSSIFCILIVPLLVWSWKKNRSPRIDNQGRQVLNFQITMTLTLFAGAFLLIFLPVAILALDQSGLTSLTKVQETRKVLP